MDAREYSRCCAVLGVGEDVTLAALERAHVQKSFALIRSGTPEQKAELRAAYEALAAELKTREPRANVVAAVPAGSAMVATPVAAINDASSPPAAPGGPVYVPPAEKTAWFEPTSFDSRGTNLVALPAILALAWAVNLTPFVGFLRGFHVWIHEFGHAGVAWMSGYRALPLPIGWTNVEPEKSNFVYFGVLFLLGVFFWAGWRERKIWPMLFAVALAGLQAWMTWKLPEWRYEAWMAFGGIGGEFCLSALLMLLFYVQLPEKFRWGVCRYVFAFLGATTFLNTFLLWRKIARFEEGIPYGSLVHGEEDGGGDMNILRTHGWTERDIVGAYAAVGTWCCIALAVAYVIFALRLDRAIGNALARLWPE